MLYFYMYVSLAVREIGKILMFWNLNFRKMKNLIKIFRKEAGSKFKPILDLVNRSNISFRYSTPS